MKFKYLLLLATCFTSMSMANEVNWESNKPVTVTYRTVHMNEGSKPLLSDVQSLNINENTHISVELNGYQYAGIMPVSVDGQELPEIANKIGGPCTLLTSEKFPEGKVWFKILPKQISCGQKERE